jgi:DNA invertase Pin-like site-specific DNA recombinase
MSPAIYARVSTARQTLAHTMAQQVERLGVPAVLEQKKRSFGSVCIYWPL